jgi:xanthine dehydrogenase accessory factor
MGIASGCDQQQRPPAGAVQLALVDRNRLTSEIREYRQRVAELTRVDAREQQVEFGSRLTVHRWHHRHMDEVLAKAEEWREAGEDVALATVVATRRGAPRPLGSKLAVTADGRMFGSVSGGCVEADVCERARIVLSGATPELVTYGIADDEAWSVGLPCGGEIDVFVEPFAAAPPIERGTSYVVVAGDGVGDRWHDDSSARTTLQEEAGRTVFAERVAPPPRLVAVGAGDIAEALCAIARPLGWHTVVVDPRSGLATRERVPSADELIVAWPDEITVDADTAVVSLVHEERLDIPALRAGVAGGAFYVGALGSKRAQEKRREQLGVVADSVRGPVGLDLGGETPAEIALEIVAEILATRKR